MSAIRLDYDKTQDCLVLRRLNYKRFSFHGFGSFLWQVKKEDISLSPDALKALADRVGKESILGDMAGASFSHNEVAEDKNQRGHIIDYGFMGPYLEVPMEEVVIDLKFYELIKTVTPTKDEPPVTKVEQEDLEAWQKMMEAEESGDETLMDQIKEHFYSREEIP